VAEHRFTAPGSSWAPADLSDALAGYFAERDPQDGFSAVGLMGN
jgi:3-oxoacyl-[acyl-carrier protein] reductase